MGLVTGRSTAVNSISISSTSDASILPLVPVTGSAPTLGKLHLIAWSVQASLAINTVTLHVSLDIDGVSGAATERRAFGQAVDLALGGIWIGVINTSLDIVARRSGVGADPTVTERVLIAVDLESGLDPAAIVAAAGPVVDQTARTLATLGMILPRR